MLKMVNTILLMLQVTLLHGCRFLSRTERVMKNENTDEEEAGRDT